MKFVELKSILLTALFAALPMAIAADSITVTAQPMTTPRSNHTATLLNDGSVLMAGGDIPGGSVGAITARSAPGGVAELYNPSGDTFTLTPIAMNYARLDHTATLLPNGKVLVAGGSDGGGTFYSSAELYDPASGSWTLTTTQMSTVRTLHTATLLLNGKVLVAGGGDDSDNFLASSEIYDPAKDTWTLTAQPMNNGRLNHTATLLSNGKVLVTGGQNGSSALSSAELYDPATDTWTLTAQPMTTGRVAQTATRLSNGKVFVAGGLDSSFYLSLASAELYNPVNDTWTASAQSLATSRNSHTATLLPSGIVLLAAGIQDGMILLNSAELYDPNTDSFTSSSQTLTDARQIHTATLLPNGKTLLAGGLDINFSPLATAELYDPGTALATVITIVAGNNQLASVNSIVSIPPAVKVTYANGVGVGAGTAVTFAVATGGGSVFAGNATTNINSIATLGTWKLGPNSGTNTLTVTDGSAPAVTFTAIGANGVPVIASLITNDNPALIGTPVSYVLTATDTDSPTLAYTFDFGDASALLTGSFPQGAPVTLTHTYTVPGDYVIQVTVSDGATTVSQTAQQAVPPPAPGATGIKNIADNIFEVINPLNGLGMQIIGSSGGVIQLGIDVSSFTRAAVNVTTDWGDIAGRSARVPGVRPVHQYIHHGIFVAKTTVTDPDTGAVLGMGRKTLVISANETGEKLPSIVRPDGARNAVGTAPNTAITLRNLQGKFTFSGSAKDTVSFSGIIGLPSGLDLSQSHEFSVAIGNVVTTTIISAAGVGALPGSPPILRNLKMMYPRSARHGLTKGGEKARIDVTFSTAALIAAGFDTEGIVKNARDAANGTTAPRQIQIGMLLDGVPYETLAPAGFQAPNNADFGNISGRTGK